MYRRHEGRIQVALIRVRGRWRLPKGQVEEGEGLKEAALREVREETGLEGRVVAKLGDIAYWYTIRSKRGETLRIFKRVYFYLIRYLRGDVSRHDEEVDEAAWVPIEEAVDRLAYPTEKETTRKATALLLDKNLPKTIAETVFGRSKGQRAKR